MSALNQTSIVLYVMKALKANGSWCGETHVQKTLFLCQELLGVPSHFKFILYKHGPYSFQLSEHLQGLIADEFVYVRSRPPYGPSLELSDDAAVFARPVAVDGHLSRRLDFIAGKVGRKGVGELERLATAVYVNEKHGVHLSLEQRAGLLTSIKPHVAADAARAAFLEVDSLQRESQKVAA
ncbi:hypothetical protein JQ604_10350 [Bradyrhizobium jicamae]|uniref:hypothetical protein n=1 Tax=Bradyrhizobium jicamae TaxID=280332 RepID=UPI001BA49355|nr:hypothetical protein [Bradyrhizobium jicamae]MBR0752585.1 hypothetical protein [Bradyrhizobium jicamae]